jgi:hypothetical protein
VSEKVAELVALDLEVAAVLPVGIGDERNPAVICSPYPSRPTSLRGLLVITRIEERPRSRRIWAPMP